MVNRDTDRIELVYDRECPVCEFYCQRIGVEAKSGQLERIDAREQSEIMDDITALGLDIDEGMVVRYDDKIYYGAEAIHKLATLSPRDGFVNRIARFAFRSPTVARLLYPLFKALRNVLLKVLGRSRINNLGIEGQDRF